MCVHMHTCMLRNAEVKISLKLVCVYNILTNVVESKFYPTECDYVPGKYPVTIPAGESSAIVTVSIIDDNLYEFSEIFQLAFVKGSLSPSARISIVGNGRSVTIVDDEGRE